MSTARRTTRPAAPPEEGGDQFADSISLEAQTLRARRDPLCSFLADQLEAIAAKARFLGATGPAQFIEREEIEEDNVRSHWYDLGRRQGRDDGLAEAQLVIKRFYGVR